MTNFNSLSRKRSNSCEKKEFDVTKDLKEFSKKQKTKKTPPLTPRCLPTTPRLGELKEPEQTVSKVTFNENEENARGDSGVKKQVNKASIIKKQKKIKNKENT